MGSTRLTGRLLSSRKTAGTKVVEPGPLGTWRTVGEAGLMFKVNGLLMPPGAYTINWPVDPTDSGNCALICGEETMKSGITEPLMVTQDPPKTVGNGLALLDTVVSLKFEPSTLINPPALKGWLLSAVLTTLVICGAPAVAVVESKFIDSTVKPDCVSTTIALPFDSGATERVKGLMLGSGAGGSGGAPGTGMGGTTIGNGTIGDSAILVAFAPTPWLNSTRESIP